MSQSASYTKVCFVMGAGNGIGRASALLFAKEGYNVALLSKSIDNLKETERLCIAEGASTMTFCIDACDAKSVQISVETIVKVLGGIDVLICAQGALNYNLTKTLTIDEHDEILNINYRSCVQATRAVLPYICKNSKHGGIIYLSTFICCQLGYPGFAPYVGAKSALTGFAKCVFEEVRNRGVKVSVIYPGMVNSGIGRKLTDDWGPEIIDIKREDMSDPMDVAKTALYIINNSDTSCPCEIILQPMKQAVINLQLFQDTRPFEIPRPVDKSKKVCVITGASKGIGRAISMRMARKGFDLALMARTQSGLDEIHALCAQENSNIKIKTYSCDVTDTEMLRNTIEQVVDDFKNINILINNAGLNRRKSSIKAPVDLWKKVLDTNLTSSMFATRFCLPYICQNDTNKAVIYVSSAIVLQPGQGGTSPYYACKHGINGFASCVFEDVRQYGVKVCAFCPGLVNTQMGTKKGPVSFFPAELLIQIEDCADAVEYIIDPTITSCPVKILLHPQAGTLPTNNKMLEILKSQYKERYPKLSSKL